MQTKTIALILKWVDLRAFSSLYSFTSGADGKYPWGNMLKVGGALYGTTSAGGAGYGTVFKILADGTFATVHTFDNQGGAGPYVGLTKNKDGILYGTTFAGGANGNGVVFSVTKK